MTIGRTDDPENPPDSPAFEAATLFGTGSRTPSGPAAHRAASTGRTHDRNRPARQNSLRSSCIRGAVHTWLYATLYCARGQAENLIKLHKTELASDRTSCRSPLANQVRLVLHTAAYWLLLTVRDAIPSPQPLATAQFTTLRMRLIKIAARITEIATRVRIAFAAACPEAELFSGVVRSFLPAGP
jgi:hypothetical protein